MLKKGSDIRIVRVAKNAVLPVAAALSLPNDSVVAAASRVNPQRIVAVEPVANATFNIDASAASASTVSIRMAPEQTEWNKTLEKEFRALAAKEASGRIEFPELQRLEKLSMIRNVTKSPRTSDEILTQLRRDRVLEKLSEALNEYVEFRESRTQGGKKVKRT
jgi:hypothetical protein